MDVDRRSPQVIRAASVDRRRIIPASSSKCADCLRPMASRLYRRVNWDFRAGRERNDLSRQRAHQGGGRREGEPACRPSPTIPASRSMRLTARRASIRRAGPDRTRDFRRAMDEDRRQAARARRDDAGAPHGAFRLRALRRLAGRSCRGIRGRASTARWSGRRAATRASATIRCSCPTATRAHSAKCRAKRNMACRRAAKACRIAPAPSSSSRRRALTERLKQTPSASTCIGRSACRNAPIATSTAMSATPPIDEARFVRAFAAEIAATAARVPGRTVSTIFFGGGTPSLMQPATVAAVLDAIARHWNIAPDAEITLEANPTSVEADALPRLPRRRRQPRVARRPGARRSRARRARAPAFGARGARRGRHRARVFDLGSARERADLQSRRTLYADYCREVGVLATESQRAGAIR